MPVSKDFSSKNESRKYPAIPEQVYTLVITDIETEEQVSYETRNKPQDEQELVIRLKFTFNILTDTKFEFEGEEQTTRGRILWRSMSPFISAPAKSGKGSHLFWIIKALFGKDEAINMTKKELTGEYLNDMIGKQFQAIVRSTESDSGNTYLNFEPSSTLELKEENYLEPINIVVDDSNSEKSKYAKNDNVKDEIVNADDIPF